MPDQIFEYHPEAIEEAWEAFHWYEQRSESAAENFWQELRRARQSVQYVPRTFAYSTGVRSVDKSSTSTLKANSIGCPVRISLWGNFPT